MAPSLIINTHHSEPMISVIPTLESVTLLMLRDSHSCQYHMATFKVEVLRCILKGFIILFVF